MIRVQRGSRPEVLSQKAQAWTKNYMDAVAGGDQTLDTSAQYGHEEVRRRLVEDAHGKCMYCESKIRHVSYPQVEHIKPKSDFPNLTFDWSNLGLACQVCNTNKGSYYEDQFPVVDPYSENPSHHFFAFGETIRTVPGNDRAVVTKDRIRLNRAGLLEARQRRLRSLEAMAERYARAQSDEVKAAYREQICEEIEDDAEFSLISRAFIQAMNISCD